MSDIPYTLLDSFSGTARLFPLPNLVLFPHAVVPLHIFEPRYRQLMEDALGDDRLMAMALLRPGWETDYYKTPPIYPVVCLGAIAAEQRLADGRFNLLLHGLRRARVVQEPPTDRLYRTASVELLQDLPPEGPHAEGPLRDQLAERLRVWYAGRADVLAQLGQLLEKGLSLGVLCDLFSFALPLQPTLKQELLEEVRVEARVRRLLAVLEGAAPGPGAAGRAFPPDFSPN
jgi:Lon protease-like protein